MKRESKWLFVVMAVAVLGMVSSGCGGKDEGAPATAGILSDVRFDGDVAEDSSGFRTVTRAEDSGELLFGLSGNTEFRALVDFPLDGATGGAIVPAGATIESAIIEIFITTIDVDEMPVLLDLVSYNTLTGREFDSPQFASRTFLLFASDFGNIVEVDVTGLMQRCVDLGLRRFQLRFILDFSAIVGLAGIDDAGANTAPFLRVRFH